MSIAQTLDPAEVPPPPLVHRPPRPLGRYAALTSAVLVLGALGGYFAGHWNGFDQGAALRRELPNGAVLSRPGPWGDLSYMPFMIAAPDALIHVQALEAKGTHWFFRGYTSDTFAALLNSMSLTPDQQDALISPSVLHVQPDGILLTPSAELVISLADDARDMLYKIMAQFPENESEIFFIRKATLDRQFAGSNLSPDTQALFNLLSVQSGDYILFSGLSALLSRVQGTEEKIHFVKALTSQQTMLLRLRITPKSDLPALVEYWGKGCWGTDVGTVMQSLANLSNGTWMNILMALPPLPTELLYDYPTIPDSAGNSPTANHTNLWTSLNFFRDDPNPNFATHDDALKTLKEDYAMPAGDARYGDVALFMTPDGRILHSGVYIADGICFTKVADGPLDPWILAFTTDVAARYAFQAAPGQPVSVTYFRSKRL